MDCSPWDLSAYHDNELDSQQRAEIEQHVGGCVACQGELADLARLDALVRGEGPADLHWQAPRRPRPATRTWLRAAVLILCLLGVFWGLRPRPVSSSSTGYQVVHGDRVYQVEARGSGTVLLEMEIEDEFGKGRVQF